MEEVAIISNIVKSEAVFAFLFISLFAYIIKSYSATQDRIMTHLDRSNASQEKTAKALDGINRTLTTLEGRIDRMEKITFKKEGIETECQSRKS